MKYFIHFFILFFIGCSDVNYPKVTELDLLEVTEDKGLPIKICFDKSTEFGTSYPSRIILKTKDGLILDKSDILISSNQQCSYLNIYIYLIPKRSNTELYNEVKKKVRIGNIKEIELFLSDAYGYFYKKENRFGHYKRVYE